MWQISNGYQPFYMEGIKYDVGLALAIQGGKREKFIDGTPVKYSNLYTGNYFNDSIFFLEERLIIIFFN